jgi:hypothetical protein
MQTCQLLRPLANLEQLVPERTDLEFALKSAFFLERNQIHSDLVSATGFARS